MTDGVEASAVLGRQAGDDGEVPVAAVLIEVTSRLAADRCLYRRVDVAWCQAVAGGHFAIDVNINRGLTKRIEDGKIVHARHRLQNGLDLIRRVLEGFEIVAE